MADLSNTKQDFNARMTANEAQRLAETNEHNQKLTDTINKMAANDAKQKKFSQKQENDWANELQGTQNSLTGQIRDLQAQLERRDNIYSRDLQNSNQQHLNDSKNRDNQHQH